MKKVINVYEAKTHFSKLLNRVMGGEDILIGKAGVPVARLVPIEGKLGQRTPGSAKGKLSISPDFDAPLPDEIQEAFEA
ncbi:MAG: type II toxin-antitoxin system Phd/YefM family antitoxin [Anaerolineales bacterium]|nr:type II toxin-antitoxin system Phd/YefM family antitoxin [Anaerolineales bacterium]